MQAANLADARKLYADTGYAPADYSLPGGRLDATSLASPSAGRFDDDIYAAFGGARNLFEGDQMQLAAAGRVSGVGRTTDQVKEEALRQRA